MASYLSFAASFTRSATKQLCISLGVPSKGPIDQRVRVPPGRATRYQAPTDELTTLDAELRRLTEAAAPALSSLKGVGPDVAGALLVAAGDNPERLRSEASLAGLCGAAPIPASSGKTTRRRLNRGGDRIANNTLWRIVMVRLASDEPTQNYMARRTQEGRWKREIIRCLKRYVAREVYRALLTPATLAAAA